MILLDASYNSLSTTHSCCAGFLVISIIVWIVMQALVEMVRFEHSLNFLLEEEQHNWSTDHLHSRARIFDSISCQSIF